jgi:UPF0271 protein
VDLGEGGTNDAELIALATSANIACGGHAGDEATIRRAIAACLEHGVAIGAHPGHEDPEHFGRRALDLPPDQIRDAVLNQLDRFVRLASLEGATVNHVKLHGALYHQANENPELADTLAAAICKLLPACHIYTPSIGAFAGAATASGLQVVPEAFADRLYTGSGSLAPRDMPGAVLIETNHLVSQALEIVSRQRVRTLDGTWLALSARTLCIHSDTPHALGLLQSLAVAFAHHQIPLQAP